MTTGDKTTREGRINSIRITEEYYWMLLRHLNNAVSEKLGEPGLKALAEGFRRYGHYRGEGMRQNPQSLAEGWDALSLVRAWDAADLFIASPNERLEVEGDASEATVPVSPGPPAAIITPREKEAISWLPTGARRWRASPPATTTRSP